LTRTHTPNIHALLIAFARLSKLRRGQFLDALNSFMYASPQRQQRWLQEWEAAMQPRAIRDTTRTTIAAQAAADKN